MTDHTVAERIVWQWANQFSYKLNIPDDKIEELSRQVIIALAEARRECWEEAARLLDRAQVSEDCPDMAEEFRRRSRAHDAE